MWRPIMSTVGWLLSVVLVAYSGLVLGRALSPAAISALMPAQLGDSAQINREGESCEAALRRIESAIARIEAQVREARNAVATPEALPAPPRRDAGSSANTRYVPRIVAR